MRIIFFFCLSCLFIIFYIYLFSASVYFSPPLFENFPKRKLQPGVFLPSALTQTSPSPLVIFIIIIFFLLASQSFCSTVWPPLGMRCCCGPFTAVYCCWQRTASSSHSVTQSTVGTQWLIKTLTGYICPFLVPRRCFDGSPLSSGPPLQTAERPNITGESS